MNAKKDESAKEKTVKIEVNKGETVHNLENTKPEGAEQHELIEEKLLEKMPESELLQKIEEFREKADENYDQYVRAQAEIENIIKRNKKEKEDWIKYSTETLIKDLLPVIDNLEKAISHSNNEDSLQALREGVELTLKGLKNTLSRSGLEEIVSLGKPFDPNYHHAISEQEDENSEPGAVINEFQKGYNLHQRLIRPAMVIISKGRPKI
jgi:molecular chaperone GrpE